MGCKKCLTFVCICGIGAEMSGLNFVLGVNDTIPPLRIGLPFESHDPKPHIDEAEQGAVTNSTGVTTVISGVTGIMGS